MWHLAMLLLAGAAAGAIAVCGLTVASTVLPRPRLAVPLDGIAGAGSVQVEAVGDFGGWGYRIPPNRRGVVPRSREALSVRTAGGREYVVTVDDATTAAALLDGLVDRHAAERDQRCCSGCFPARPCRWASRPPPGPSRRPGEQLPPAREVAESLGVNARTILRGYQRLRDEGLIELRHGRGAAITVAPGVADQARLTEPGTTA